MLAAVIVLVSIVTNKHWYELVSAMYGAKHFMCLISLVPSQQPWEVDSIINPILLMIMIMIIWFYYYYYWVKRKQAKRPESKLLEKSLGLLDSIWAGPY